jgi:hypothetical protein
MLFPRATVGPVGALHLDKEDSMIKFLIIFRADAHRPVHLIISGGVKYESKTAA